MNKVTKKANPVSMIASVFLLAVLSGLLVFFVIKRAGQGAMSESEADEAAVFLQPVSEADTTEAEAIASIIISEAMPSNKSAVINNEGNFSDWIELYNNSDITAELSQFSLSCGGKDIDISGITLAGYEYALVFCSASLPSDGSIIKLEGPDGKELDRFEYSACENDMSVYHNENGEVVYTCFYSPGYTNGSDGYEAYQSSLEAAGPIAINEVMVYNNSYLRTNKTYYDWVELKNISSSAVNLSEYYISDSNSDHLLFQLPDYTLSPGELYIIYCTGDDTAEGKDYAPFGLDAGRDELYLSSSDGTLIDSTPLRLIPLNGSYGRIDGKNGYFYFSSPSPATDNSSYGYRSVTDTPVSLREDGVFNDVSSVTVELSGPGNIYYTTDGSVPTTSSNMYTGAFEVSATCVIRAACVEEGKLTGTPLSLSYIINENHSLPVVSLVTTQSDWDMLYGSPSQDFEMSATVEYFGDDGSFSIECGYKLHGATSKMAQSKKSLKLLFKSRYDGELNYDLFGNGVTEFSSLILRAAQEDVYSTFMRDNLMHQLSQQAFPELSTQDYKYSVLYVNGKYWGMYNIREAHSAEHFANHNGLDASDVTMYREVINGNCPQLGEIYNSLVKNPEWTDEKYAEICSVLDVDSVMAWTIIEAYSGNYDIHPTNVRFYYVESENKLYYSLADLDLGFFDPYTFQYPMEMNGEYAYKYNQIAHALLNFPEYKQKFIEALSVALNGPLSDENVLATLNSLADEIRPEIYADRTRWGGTIDNWEKMVQDMRDFITDGKGRAANVAFGLKRYVSFTDADFNTWFGDIEQTSDSEG